MTGATDHTHVVAKRQQNSAMGERQRVPGLCGCTGVCTSTRANDSPVVVKQTPFRFVVPKSRPIKTGAVTAAESSISRLYGERRQISRSNCFSARKPFPRPQQATES
jgi:hypothetical protein